MGRTDSRSAGVRVADATTPVEHGRACFAHRAWAEAWDALTRADVSSPLGAADLELMSTVAYLLGRDVDYARTLERAFHAFQDDGEARRAARCAYWLGLRMTFRGDAGQATAWYSRARRLIAPHADCVEHGYLLLATADDHVASGDLDAADAAAADAVAIGDRIGDADLAATARHVLGRVRIDRGDVAGGLALLDEAMLAVASGELSPLVSGLAYCNAISGCQQAFALARASEWTEALSDWCAAQPDMVAFSGVCRVHRAEIMQLRGAWNEALDEARRAFDRCQQVRSRHAAALALYQQGEVLRLRGAFAQAEDAYHRASGIGCDPQPGLALLRAAQGRLHTAATAIDRALCATADRWQRAKLLPARVEIALAAGDVDAAARAGAELDAIAAHGGTDELAAIAASARAAIACHRGDAQAALVDARRALGLWQRIDAPYPAARVRMLAGVACRALGDLEGSRLELDAARATFERLDAKPDLQRLDAMTKAGASARPRGLTRRELQVLRLVAAGKTNKAIAGELFVSEKTVDRHVSSILAKLDVPSRAAATARAYEEQLIPS